MEITPFTVDVPEADVRDLQARLANTRWPSDVVTDWSRGTPASYARELAERWANDFDWAAQQARLNTFPQFTTTIDGQPIHFVHVRSAVAGRDAAAAGPRLSELVRRVHPDDRAARGPRSARRTRRGRVPRRHPVDPGFRVLDAAAIARAGTSSGRRGLRPDHAGTRLRAVRRRMAATWAPGSPRSSASMAGDRIIGSLVVTDPGAIATEYTPPTDHLTPEEQAASRAQGRAGRGLRLPRAPDDAAAVDRLRAHGLAGDAAHLDRREGPEWTDPAKELPEDAVDLDHLLTLVSVYWFGRGGAGAANFLYEAMHAEASWGADPRPAAGLRVVRRRAAGPPRPGPEPRARLLERARRRRPLPRHGGRRTCSSATCGRSSRRSADPPRGGSPVAPARSRE